MGIDALTKAANAAGYAAVPDEDEPVVAPHMTASPDAPAVRKPVALQSTALALVSQAQSPSQWLTARATQVVSRGVSHWLGRGATA